MDGGDVHDYEAESMISPSNPSSSQNNNSASCSVSGGPEFDDQIHHILLNAQAIAEGFPRYSLEIWEFMDNVLKYTDKMSKFMAKLGWKDNDDDNVDDNNHKQRGKAVMEVEPEPEPIPIPKPKPYSSEYKDSPFLSLDGDKIYRLILEIQIMVEYYSEVDRKMQRYKHDILKLFDYVTKFMAANFGYNDDEDNGKLSLVGPQPLLQYQPYSLSAHQIHHIILLFVHSMSESFPWYVLQIQRFFDKVDKFKDKANRFIAKSRLQMYNR